MKSFIIFNSTCIAIMTATAIWLYKHAPVGICLFFLLCPVIFIVNLIRMSNKLKKKDAEIKVLRKERDDLLDDQDDIYAN